MRKRALLRRISELEAENERLRKNYVHALEIVARVLQTIQALGNEQLEDWAARRLQRLNTRLAEEDATKAMQEIGWPDEDD